MRRIILVHRMARTSGHWHAAEAEERAARLRSLGYEVGAMISQDIATMRVLGEDPPDAFVIDLARLPSQGGALGTWVRQRAATRGVPIVFVTGDPEKSQRVAELIPDAVYTDWDGIGAVIEWPALLAIERALAHRPEAPIVPGTMDGYSGTPLPKKLGIEDGSVVALLGAPEDFEATLGDLSRGVELRWEATGPAQVILLFASSHADLAARFPAAASVLAVGGRLWILWPKKASGVRTDIDELEVRAYGLEHGYVDYKISAIDATWSGLCCARRSSK
jgi:CheY-like chemotaxis protein